jgi:enoyl-CoA hydratase/carnithine racemase
MADVVIVERGSVTEIRLDRAGARNALSTGLAERLAAAAGAVGESGARAAIRRAAIRRAAIRRGADVDLSAGLDIEDAAWRAAVFSDDRREGVHAFVERRPPVWSA